MKLDFVPPPRGSAPFSTIANARRDALLLSIVICTVVLLIWNGSLFVRNFSFAGEQLGASARLAGTALMLNVALLLFGWRRYVDLQHEAGRRLDSEARAALMATTDTMTGLYNRKGFADRVAELDLVALERGGHLAIISIQLHRFKGINDCHGFDVGDEVLRRIAAALVAALDSDAIAARMSGDEFAVALIHLASQRSPLDHAGEAMLHAVTRAHEVQGQVIQVGAFVGMAVRDGPDVTVADLLRRADIALDHAKTARAVRPVWFDTGMERALLEQSEIEQGIRYGIEQGQFLPYFEPQIDLATGTIVGFEALARWNHPSSGMIMPDVFIPIAEQIGVIGPLSEQIMRAAFAQAAGWDSSIKLSVNISPVQLADSWLAHRIVRLLSETGLPADRLVVEITESSLFADIEQARSIVTSLKNQGIRLALDDFGTGFSSLSHLRTLPFDVIKIDRSFISTIHRDRESAAIVRAVTTLATALDMPVTVEGIEDAATEAAVRGMGCTIGQGWYFGKPMAGEHATELLRTGLVSNAGDQSSERLRSVG